MVSQRNGKPNFPWIMSPADPFGLQVFEKNSNSDTSRENTSATVIVMLYFSASKRSSTILGDN